MQSGDEETAASVAEGQLPQGAAAASRKLRARQHLLRSEAILAALGGAKPPARVVARKPKGAAAGVRARPQAAAAAGGGAPSAGGRKRRTAAGDGPVFDLWGEDGPSPGTAAGAAAAGTALNAALATFIPPAGVVPPAEAEALVISAKRRRTGGARGVARTAAAPHIPALEIDDPGCSFNPDSEQHQDALAAAVAGEMKKIIRWVLWVWVPTVLLLWVCKGQLLTRQDGRLP